MDKLNIFVSSTCYDLSQLRTDLSDFISSSGHSPVLSEFDNFPVNPHKKTFDNCITAVKNNADIFILIVGNRYGTVIDTGKSITNTEFLTAKAKGIPIFVFIDKKTLSSFSFWKENKDANFEKFVDNTKIFEFISEIRDDGNLWTFEFEKAQDIVLILKYQMSYLFKESLKIHSKYNSLNKELIDIGISNEALNILLQKDSLFEFDFFSTALCDEMEKARDYKNDLAYRIHYEPKHFMYEKNEVLKWMHIRSSTIISLVQSLSNIINTALPKFINESGKPADLKGLYYVAKAYAKIFESIIKWTIDTRNAIVPEECENLKEKLALYSRKIINQIWEFPIEVNKQIKEAKIKSKTSDDPIHLELQLDLNIDPKDIENYFEEFEKFKLLFQQDSHQFD